MSILDEIVAATRLRVETDKQRGIREAHPTPLEPFAFEKALRAPGISFICEVKKASPSKGVIAEDFPYQTIARDYEEAGAAAVSVLTEPRFFQGADSYLTDIRGCVSLPLLRKDFTVDGFQLEQAAAIGADAVLLIAAVLRESEIREFLRLADALGLSCLVEVHDERELKTAVSCGARVLGVNNRNLRDFSVDTGGSLRLRKLAPPELTFVSESGIRTAEEVCLLAKNGVDAVLVGEALMRSTDKKTALQRLKGKEA